MLRGAAERRDTAYKPSCSTRIRAVLRILPVFAPIEVSTITGLPRRSPPCSPFVAS